MMKVDRIQNMLWVVQTKTGEVYRNALVAIGAVSPLGLGLERR